MNESTAPQLPRTGNNGMVRKDSFCLKGPRARDGVSCWVKKEAGSVRIGEKEKWNGQIKKKKLNWVVGWGNCGTGLRGSLGWPAESEKGGETRRALTRGGGKKKRQKRGKKLQQRNKKAEKVANRKNKSKLA